jgi:hypothetical protein
MGGDAVASVLMGDVAPTGRLPITMYPSDFIERNMTDYDLANGNGTTHLYYKGTPLFPFGWGVSYSTFTFEILTTNMSETSSSSPPFTAASLVAGSQEIKHVVRVTNTGRVASAVSVQAFVGSDHADAVFNDELYDFDITTVLSPGDTQLLTFTLPTKTLALVDDDGDQMVSPGLYRLKIGGAGSGRTRDEDFAKTTLNVFGDASVYLWRLSAARVRWQQSQIVQPTK